ncbi:MAG: lysine--tRNA ligase [Verrucomicrobia bacterium]|nr:MAG: lysine--tRNA ligase [Verrucomicrobiota bacterium]
MEEENELIALRRKKLDALRAKGIEPFGPGFEVSGSIAEVREQFKEGETLRAAGRITAHRDMGKSHFLDLRDTTGRIQIYIHAKEVGPELVELFRLLDIGDFIGIEGTCFVTKTGEPTLKVRAFRLLAKALRPLPEKWHGLQDIEARYRQRYLDLLTNEHSREVFEKRIAIVRETRRFFEDRGFLEVETPILQTIAGGAAAEPFSTHHKALGLDLYLRIAPELYLKRLLVGGFNRVFEINRNFRNEGISRKHNPEFTMLEAYWAYADFEKMANLVEELICHLAEKIHALDAAKMEGGTPVTPGSRTAEARGSSPLQIEHRDADGKIVRTINLKRPWRRARYVDVMCEVAGKNWFELSSQQRRDHAMHEFKLDILPQLADYEVTQHVFEKLVEEKTIDPLFVTHCPKELVPLAKQNTADNSLVDVFELIINGAEIAPGYSELNDPDAQRQRLLEQAGEEKQKIDEEFLLALEHGMPPAGGFGIGMDRLTMLLTGAESIRDVILFPLLRPKK